MNKYLYIILLLLLIACDKNDDDDQDKPIVSNDYIRVAPNLQLLGDGQVEELAIEANCNWTVTKSEEWLTVTPTTGSGSQRVKVSAGKNSTGAERLAILTVKGGTAPERQVMVTQGKSTEIVETKSLNVTPLSIEFESVSDAKPITITSNTNWTINAPAWCKLSASTGSGNGVITVTASDNPDTQQRTGQIIVSGDGVSSVSIQILQKATEKNSPKEPGKNDNQPPA